MRVDTNLRLIDALRVIDVVELQLLALHALVSQTEKEVCMDDIKMLLSCTIESCRHDI